MSDDPIEILDKYNSLHGITQPHNHKWKATGKLVFTYPQEYEVRCKQCSITNTMNAHAIVGNNVDLSELTRRIELVEKHTGGEDEDAFVDYG